MRRLAPLLVSVYLLLAAIDPPAACAENPVVRVTTPLGSFDIELCSEVSAVCTHAAPLTAANFLAYVQSGAYANSFVHRRVFNFVIQGGSFWVDESNASDPIQSVQTNDPVASEFTGFSNVRGTVSVPLPSDPPGSQNPCDTNENAGTSGWFVNVGNNAGLDCGLFTVFGVVLGDGMDVVDDINQLSTLNGGGAFAQLPILDTYECVPVSNVCTGSVIPYLVYSDMQVVPEAGGALASIAGLCSLAALARRRTASS